MSDAVKLAVGGFTAPRRGTLVVFVDETLALGAHSREFLAEAGDLLTEAAAARDFKGKRGGVLDILRPSGLPLARLVVVGLGKAAELASRDVVRLGGTVAGSLGSADREVTIAAELPQGAMTAEHCADLVLGLRLRRYVFDRYKTQRKDGDKDGDKDGEEKPAAIRVTLAAGDGAAVRRALRGCDAVADGVNLARDLVNEPPNLLYPAAFADRVVALKKTGLAVQVLDGRALARLGMHALLGVSQGSRREPRVVIMRWNGGRRSEAPVAFIGKGVTFDTGGISMKPAAGMEDMKGDMAGAACVTGLMQALAARKAKVNAVGVIGLVENMPDGNAQRPGDIVTSMSGQTIEIINTDAEGRLVLGDVLWYVKEKLKPRFMVDLATLTGAIIVALGQEYAGLFSNNDELVARLQAAGDATGERVWRMPLAPEYDKLIDSKFADMKNTGGRHGGAITAAQFLQRFVGDVPWAHLDIAGTGFGSPSSDINRSWGSGWGVRLLDALVAAHYEA